MKNFEVLILIPFRSSHKPLTEQSLCLVCDETIPPEELTTVQQKGIRIFINLSLEREDKSKSYLKNSKAKPIQIVDRYTLISKKLLGELMI